MLDSYALAPRRLVLRPVRTDDATALHAHWTHPDVRRYLWDDAVIERAQVDDIIAESNRLFKEHRYGLWSVCPSEEDPLMGCAGFWTFHEPPRVELILSLSPEHWGQGYAEEAGRALIDYGFGTLGWKTVYASTDVPNVASRRLLDRLGFAFTHRADTAGLSTLFYTKVLHADGS